MIFVVHWGSQNWRQCCIEVDNLPPWPGGIFWYVISFCCCNNTHLTHDFLSTRSLRSFSAHWLKPFSIHTLLLQRVIPSYVQDFAFVFVEFHKISVICRILLECKLSSSWWDFLCCIKLTENCSSKIVVDCVTYICTLITGKALCPTLPTANEVTYHFEGNLLHLHMDGINH